MVQAAPLVPITSLGPVSAATVAFRSGGRLHVTAVIKATFAIAPEGRMTPLVADPILADELPDPSGRGLRAAGDLAPYLGQTDVLLTGHAEVLPSFVAPTLRVWLAVVRDHTVRIDRWIELDATVRVGPARGHLALHGTGPISRAWPKRSHLLGPIDPRCLHGPVVDIPEGFNWSYFQAAPAEQRMELLRCDEWLVLGGIFAQRPKLRTQLPEARALARLYRRGQVSPRTGDSIQLVADTLQIDADRRCASILWRGHIPVEEAEMASLHVVAGMEVPGKPIPWADPFPAAQPAAGSIFGETTGLTEEQSLKLAALLGTPFEKPRPPADKGEARFAGTSEIPEDFAAKLAATPAVPFEAPRASAVEAEVPFAGTSAISPELEARLGELPATPFEASRAAAATGADRFAGTSALPAEIALKAAAVPATPFDKAPTVVPREEIPFGGTLAISNELASKLGEGTATLFDKPRTAPAPISTAAVAALPRPVQARDRVGPRAEPDTHSAAQGESRFASTFALSADLASRLDAAPATPFEGRELGRREPRTVQAPMCPREVAAPPIVVAPVAALAPTAVEVERLAPLFAVKASGEELEDLGEIFLVAMEEAGETV